MVELLWSTFHEPHWWASLELWAASRTNDELAASLLPHERRLGGVVRSAIDAMRGIALTYAFDRRDPARDPNLATWKDLAMIMLAD
jgi:hypothetical protein